MVKLPICVALASCSLGRHEDLSCLQLRHLRWTVGRDQYVLLLIMLLRLLPLMMLKLIGLGHIPLKRDPSHRLPFLSDSLSQEFRLYNVVLLDWMSLNTLNTYHLRLLVSSRVA
jgi:hypothetical protein